MFVNRILSFFQNIFSSIYEKSFFLQKIDWLIALNIFLVIFSSTFMQSDAIGIFAMFSIVLTVIKLLFKKGEKFELSLADKFLLAYFMIVIVSVAGSSLFYLSLKGFLKTFTYIGFYVSLIHYLKDNLSMIKYFLLAICLAVSFETVVAYMQNFASVDEISGWQDTSHLNPEEVMTRVYGTLKPYNPNLFGGYMLASIPAILVMPTISKKLTIPSIIIGVLSIIAIVLTGCRGAYIGMFFQIISLLVITYEHLKPVYKKIFSTIVALCFAGLTCLILSITALRARVTSIFAMRSDSSNSFRFNVYHSCVNMFKDNSLLGIGVGNQNFREIYGLYMKTGFDALSAYNIYLEIAVESGMFALIAFLGFMITNVVKSVKYVLENKTKEAIYVFIALLSLVGILTHGIVDTVFFRPQIQFIFWTMMGIIRIILK